MITQRLDVSVLSAPLAAIDRRSLSQAWYSALRLGRDVSPRSRAANRLQNAVPALSPRAAAASPTSTPSVRSGIDRAAAPPQRSAYDRAPVEAEASERRAAAVPLARDIERIFAGAQLRPKRATLTIRGSGKRVYVLIGGSGARLHLIAICSPSIRETVARALARARFALASRGITVDVDGEVLCS